MNAWIECGYSYVGFISYFDALDQHQDIRQQQSFNINTIRLLSPSFA